MHNIIAAMMKIRDFGRLPSFSVKKVVRFAHCTFFQLLQGEMGVWGGPAPPPFHVLPNRKLSDRSGRKLAI